MGIFVAGPGIAPGPGAYETPEILLLHPAKTIYYVLSKKARNKKEASFQKTSKFLLFSLKNTPATNLYFKAPPFFKK